LKIVLNLRIVNGKMLSDTLTARIEIVQFVRVQGVESTCKMVPKMVFILFLIVLTGKVVSISGKAFQRRPGISGQNKNDVACWYQMDCEVV